MLPKHNLKNKYDKTKSFSCDDHVYTVKRFPDSCRAVLRAGKKKGVGGGEGVILFHFHLASPSGSPFSLIIAINPPAVRGTGYPLSSG